jgi:hypothetical protein
MFMKRSILILILGLTATMVAPGAAILLPGMPCPNPDVSCSVSPGTSTAADPTFVLPNDPGVVRLGIFVVPGDVVLFETPNGRSLIALPGATLFSSAIVPPVSAPLPRLSLMPSRSAFYFHLGSRYRQTRSVLRKPRRG